MLLPGGLLMQRVALLTPTRTPTTSGGFTNTYAETATVPGQFQEVVGGGRAMEKVLGDAPLDVEYVTASLDCTGVTLTSDMRLRDPDGNDYEIVQIRRQGVLARVTGRKV